MAVGAKFDSPGRELSGLFIYSCVWFFGGFINFVDCFEVFIVAEYGFDAACDTAFALKVFTKEVIIDVLFA